MRLLTIIKNWGIAENYINGATEITTKLQLVQVFGDQWIIGKHDNLAMIELCQALIQRGCFYTLGKPDNKELRESFDNFNQTGLW